MLVAVAVAVEDASISVPPYALYISEPLRSEFQSPTLGSFSLTSLENKQLRNRSFLSPNPTMARWAKGHDCCLLMSLIIVPVSLLVFILSLAFAPFLSLFLPNHTIFHNDTRSRAAETALGGARSKMAVCLVGGARKFELTGPSIVKNILEVYPNADLFLHSPYDKNSFKFVLLKGAPRIAWVRIFKPNPIPESESQLRVLTHMNSRDGIQGLLQYFNLVEGCLTMIEAYQQQKNITYDWILRTRVDGFWSAPLKPEHFVSRNYIVPSGSSYGGLNDRLGIGDFNTSKVALSRLSLIPQLDTSGFRQLNSESSFRAQLTTQKVTYETRRFPFCIVTDKKYAFPPGKYGVLVAAISSPGPLSGAKCWPCKAACRGSKCVEKVMRRMDRSWSWTDWENGSLELCDARGEWEKGWEEVFDGTSGPSLAGSRKRVRSMKLRQCLVGFGEIKRRSENWDVPAAEEMCKLGLGYT